MNLKGKHKKYVQNIQPVNQQTLSDVIQKVDKDNEEVQAISYSTSSSTTTKTRISPTDDLMKKCKMLEKFYLT